MEDAPQVERVSTRKSVMLIVLTCGAAWGLLFAAAAALYQTF